MFKKLEGLIIGSLSRKRGSKFLFEAAIFLLIVLPVAIIALSSYVSTKQNLNDLTFSRREAIAELAATLLQERLDSIRNLGVSLATRVQFRNLIAQKKWDAAATILTTVPRDFPFIERLFLTDISGTLTADVPRLPGSVGKNFSLRDWYIGISKNWEPYLSEVYKRAAPPQYNVVAYAVPIKADNGSPIAILVLQIKLDTLLHWIKDLKVGESGFAYVTDAKGHIAAHPHFDPQGEIINYALVPAVQKALRGEEGVEILFNYIENEERISAYQPIPGYNWVVVATEPTSAAFALRNQSLNNILTFYGSMLAVAILLGWALLKLMNVILKYREQEKALLESVGDGLIAADPAFKILVINPAAKVMLGWASADLDTTVPLIEDEAGKIVPEDEQPFILALRTGRKVVTGLADQKVYYYVRKDGTKFPVAITATPVVLNDKTIGVIVVFRDITKEIELDLAKSEFISLASHQLKTPSSALKWNIELLTDGSQGPLNENQKLILSDMHDISVQMIEVVESLLNVSRLELGTFIAEPVPISYREVVKEVLLESKEKISARNLKVEERYPEALPLIPADPGLAKIICENVISNAVKYTPHNGTISIAIENQPESRSILITVKDSGYGIPEKQQSLIFTKMFRGDNVRDIEGTGFGLYFVKSIVEFAGGKIWFKSKEGAGTTFYISLPIVGMRKKEGTSKLSDVNKL